MNIKAPFILLDFNELRALGIIPRVFTAETCEYLLLIFIGWFGKPVFSLATAAMD